MREKRTKISKPFYKKWWFVTLVVLAILGTAFPSETEESTTEIAVQTTELISIVQEPTSDVIEVTTEKITETYQATQKVDLSQKVAGVTSPNDSASSYEFNGNTYKIIKVDGGDISGYRQPNVAVNIGFGDRNYWAFTNEHSQLVYVIADEIILQDELNEILLSDGRYYTDEAKVPGTEDPDLDEGHVIADSLGGVSNAYNITPQDSTLNRYGDQAYMEKVIRDAGGCTNFIATISYLSTDTQIPLHYRFEYDLKGNRIIDEFDNVNPDKVNAALNTTEAATNAPTSLQVPPVVADTSELKRVDTNGNGKVTIAEAKAAGFKMPIYSDHWLYNYMDDRDGDGKVGE
jgi:hypothetical protein